MFEKFGMGAIPSPPDERDYHISKAVPMSIDISDKEFCLWIPDIKNQGAVGSCVAHSCAYLKEIIEREQSGRYHKFSPGYIYGNRADGDYKGEGMFPREALKSLLDNGIVKHELFPYNEEYPSVNQKIRENQSYLIRMAEPYKISSFYRLYNEVDVKIALKSKMPVSILAPLYESFMKIDFSGIVENPGSSEDQLKVNGYHQMTIIGWKEINNTPYWIVLNSWDNTWGNRGLCYMRFDYPVVEYWTVSDNIMPPKSDMATKIILTVGSSVICVDNIVKTMDVAPFIQGNRVFVPIRFVAEALGCKVEWQDSGDITISNTEMTIAMKIGNSTYIVNGKSKSMDVVPFTQNDRTFVPIRFVAEALGCKVEWDGVNEKAIITNK